MRYPVAIEPGTEMTAFGVVVPDLPGCFSAGDSLDEALNGAEEAAAAWIDAALDAGGSIPAPSSLEAFPAERGLCRLELRRHHRGSRSIGRHYRAGEHHAATPGAETSRCAGTGYR